MAKAVNPFPESQIFQQLVARERTADARIQEHKQEAVSCLAPIHTVTKKLRVYIFATHTNQPTSLAASDSARTTVAPVCGDGRKEAGANETSDGGPPAWALHVHGRLLELSGEVPQRGMLPAPQPFTHYLRNLSVQLTAAPTVAVRSAPIRKTVAPAPRAFGSKSRLVKLPQNPVGRPVVASTASGPPNSSQPEPRQSGPATEQAGDSPASTHAAASDAAETEVDTTEWSSAQQSGPPRNAFVIRRLGSKAMTAKVTLDVKQSSQRYVCSQQLSALIGLSSSSRARALQAVSSHILQNNLEAGGTVTCDSRLRAVTGRDEVPLSQVGDAVGRHLTATAPLTINYAIRLDGTLPPVPDCYDIEIDLAMQPFSSQSAGVAAPFLLKLEQKLNFSEAATKVHRLVKRVNEHVRRRTLLLGFSQEPASYLNGIVATQGRDLRQLPGEGGSEQLYAPTRSELFHGRWVEDACLKSMRGN